jgi:hypothetical protein
MAKKKTKDLVIPQDDPLTPLQKGVIGAMVSFVPFFFLIILPYMVRSHILNELHLSEEQLVSQPIEINMVPTGKPVPLIRIRLQNMEASFPRDFMPVKVTPDMIAFRQEPRRLARTMLFGAYPEAPKISLNATGVMGWFIPSDLRSFFEYILPATWHPARAYTKAQFFVSQGINGSIFSSVLNDEFRLFIFPFSGNSGYFGRVFQNDTPRYAEFSFYGDMQAVSLREWVDFGCRIRSLSASETSEISKFGGMTLSETLAKAETQNSQQWQAVEHALNKYYRIGSTSWLLPVVAALESKGFYRETIEFKRAFSASVKSDTVLTRYWNELLNRSVHQVLKMEIDPHLQLNKLDGHCQNLGEFSISKVKLRIILQLPTGEKSFKTEIFSTSPLHAGQDRTIEIEPPQGLLVHHAKSVTWVVEDLDIKD